MKKNKVKILKSSRFVNEISFVRESLKVLINDQRELRISCADVIMSGIETLIFPIDSYSAIWGGRGYMVSDALKFLEEEYE